MIDFTKEGRVGDRVRNLNGEIGAIKSLRHNETYPVLVEYAGGNLQSYTATGKDHIYDRIPYIMFTNGSITIDQGSPPEHVPKESESETYWRRFYPVTVGSVTTIDRCTPPEERYCGLTITQWQRVIDEKFTLGFSDNSIEHAKMRSDTDTLRKIHKHGAEYPFIPKHEAMWRYASIPDMEGIRKPHFGGTCPTDHEGLISVKLHSGAWINISLENGRDVWIWRKGDERSTDIMEYIELP